MPSSLCATSTSSSTRTIDRLTRFLPVKLLSSGFASPLLPQNSGDFVSILSADGFIELQPSNKKTEVKCGEPVNYYAWL